MPIIIGGAIVGSALVGGAATYFGSRAQADAAREAGYASDRATDKQIQAQMEMFNRNIELSEPYRQIGVGALSELGGFQSTFTPSQLPEFSTQDLPFLDELEAIEREEGERGVTRALSAAGISKSGKGISVVGDFQRKLGAGQSQRRYGYGVDAYNRALQQSLIRDEQARYADTTRYGRILNRVNIGRGAATQQGGAALTTGANLANIYGASGQRAGNLALQQGQIQSDLYKNLANTVIAGTGAGLYYGGYGARNPNAATTPPTQPIRDPYNAYRPGL